MNSSVPIEFSMMSPMRVRWFFYRLAVLVGLFVSPFIATSQPFPDISDQFAVDAYQESSSLVRGTLNLKSTALWVATNSGPAAVLAPLHVVIEPLDNRVSIQGVSGGPGAPPYGAGYVDLTPQLIGGTFLPPGGSVTGSVIGIRKKDVSFLYSLTLHGVLNQLPVVDPGGPYSGGVGDAIDFDAGDSYDPDGHDLTFVWTFGGHTSITGAVASQTFSLPGIYRTRLVVTDDLGASVTSSVPVEVASTQAFALARSRTLSSEGIPLTGVIVEEVGPRGTNTLSEGGEGFLSLGQGPGLYDWTFRHPHALTVYRSQELASNSLAVLPHPWMTLRPEEPTGAFSPLSDTSIDHEAGGTLSFGAGAFSTITSAYLSRLHGQSLPVKGPPGWSPLAGFWLELDQEPTMPGTATLTLADNLTASDRAVLAVFDETLQDWRVDTILAGTETHSISVSIPGSGVYAVWVADEGPGAPANPVAGQPLPASSLSLPNPDTASADSRADPASRPASTDAAAVTTTGVVDFSFSNAVPSGVGFPVQIDEEYHLLSGETQGLPGYDSFICAYRRPGGGENHLQARFPLRPRRLLDGHVLDVAEVDVTIRARDLQGRVLTESGGVLEDATAGLQFAPGDLSGPAAVQFRSIEPSRIESLSNAVPVLAFQLDAPDLLNAPMLAAGPYAPGTRFVLARHVFSEDTSGWKPVERLKADGGGDLISLEPSTGPRLPGLVRAGQYTLFQVVQTQILVSGTAIDDGGQPVVGARVRIPGQPWLDITGPHGTYQLLTVQGGHDVMGTKPGDGLEGESPVSVPDTNTVENLDITLLGIGPRILATEPTNLSTRVRGVAPIRVWFSKPIEPASFFNNDLSVIGPSNAVSGIASLSQDGRSASFLADQPLDPNVTYTVTVAAAVSDDLGQPIAGPRSFSFTTAPEVPRAPAGLTLYEPGATNCPCIGAVPGYSSSVIDMVCVQGGPGTADPDTALVLINQNQGETATVVSGPDGSFLNFIPAGEDDFIEATFVNANGTRITIPVTRQLFDDGRIGLYRAGGILEAESDGSPVQVFIEPGAVERRMVFDVDAVSRSELLQGLNNTEPLGGKILGGALYAEELGELKEAADIRIPIQLTDVDLEPGQSMEDLVFTLVVPLQRNGQIFYQQIDRMDFVSDGSGGGFLETRSPPFIGLLARRLNALETSGYAFQSTVSRFSSSQTGATRARSSIPAVAVWERDVGTGVTELGDSEGIIAGRVVAKPLDGDVSTERSVGGAVIAVRDGNIAMPDIGSLPAGQVFVLSERDGEFAMTLPRMAPSYFLAAIHPRFPGQVARSAAFGFVPQEETVIQTKLAFALGSDDADAGSASPPFITVGHTPPYPPEGTGSTAYAEVTISVIDDGDVADLSIEVGESVKPLTDKRIPSNTVNVILANSSDFGGRLINTYRFQSEKIARVNFTIRAVDDIQQESSLVYPINFGGVLPVAIPTSGVSRLYVQRTWPVDGATNLPAFTPVQVRFNAPLHPIWLQKSHWDNWLTLEHHEATAVIPSEDGREITIQYDGPVDQPLALTIAPPLQAEDGTVFNQTGDTNLPSAFMYKMYMSSPVSVALPGFNSGAGMQMRGAFAYAIEGSGGIGAVKVYSLEDPHVPTLVQTIDLDIQPTDIAIIDRYPLADAVTVQPSGQIGDWSSSTGSFVCVFSGLPSSTDFPEPKFIDAFRIKPNGELFTTGSYAGGAEVSAALSLNPASLVSKSKWDPPFLGFLDFSSEGAGLNLLNFQSFYTGYKMDGIMRERLPIEPDPGRDANRDGDYVDPQVGTNFGDVPPLPGREQTVLGHEFSWAPLDGDELLMDFDFSSEYGMVAAITRHRTQGHPRFWTVLSRYPSDLTDAFVDFDVGEVARRVFLLPATTLETSHGPVLRDLALVTFAGLTNTNGVLTAYIKVVDITVPDNPAVINTISLPEGERPANTLEKRLDGKLALVTGRNTFLLDPSKLLELSPTDISHPSIISEIDGTGVGARKTVSSAAGIYLNGFGNGGLVQAEPSFEFVRFNREVFDPSAVIGQGPGLWDQQEIPEVLDPINYTSVSDTNLPPSDPERNYYVKVHAPGGVGKTLPLAIVAANANGRTFKSPSPESLPVTITEETFGSKQVVSTAVQGFKIFLGMLSTAGEFLEFEKTVKDAVKPVDFENPDFDAWDKQAKAIENLMGIGDHYMQLLLDFIELGKEMPTDFTGIRMSNDPTHPDYNVYLAGPFTLSTEPIKVLQLADLKAQVPSRVYLQAAPQIWTGLSPLLKDHDLLGRYASQIDYRFQLYKNNGTEQATLNAAKDIKKSLDAISGEKSRALNAGETPNVTGMKIKIALTIVKYLQEIADGTFVAEGFPGAHGRHPVSISEPNPVIFIPGTMASYIDQDDLLYPIVGSSWMVGSLFDGGDSLEMNPEGNNVTGKKLVPSDVVRVIPELWAANVDYPLDGDLVQVAADILTLEVLYRDIINYLRMNGYSEYDYRARVFDLVTNPFAEDPTSLASAMADNRRLSGTPRLNLNPSPLLFVYPYDWRQDNGVSAANLNQYLDLVRTIRPDLEKIDIVAHSMGGLVARRYIEDNPGVVDRLITIGSPLMGAPKAFSAMKTGDYDDMALNILIPPKYLRRLGTFFPGLHQLLPARGLFDLGGTPFRETGWDINGNGIFYEDYTYSEYTNALAGPLLRDVLQDYAAEALEDPQNALLHSDYYLNIASNAHPAVQNLVNFHERNGYFGDWANDESGVKYHHIIGMQGKPSTVGRVEFSTYFLPEVEDSEEVLLSMTSVEHVDADNNGPDPQQLIWGGGLPVGGRQMRLRPIVEPIRMSGDGTVPLLSATRGFGSQRNLNAPDAKLYPFVTTREADHNRANHNGMMQYTEMQQLVVDILERKEPETTQVALSAPSTSVEGSEITVSASYTLPPGATSPQMVFDFGDGVTKVLNTGETSGTHVYERDGEFIISCGVKVKNGLHGFDSKSIEVQNAPPVVELYPEGFASSNTSFEVANDEVLVVRAEVRDPGFQDRHTYTWFIDGEEQPQAKNAVVVDIPPDGRTSVVVRVVAADEAMDTGEKEKTFIFKEVPINVGGDIPPQIYVAATNVRQRILQMKFAGHERTFLEPEGISVITDLAASDFALIMLKFLDGELSEEDEAGLDDEDKVSLGKGFLKSALKAYWGIIADVADRDIVWMQILDEDTRSRSINRMVMSGAKDESDVMVEATMLHDGIPARVDRYEFDPDGSFSYTYIWPSNYGILEDDDANEVLPVGVATNAAARDKQGPIVSGIKNPWSRNIYLVGKDNFTPEEELDYFIGFDLDHDESFLDERFYELTNNIIHESAYPIAPVAIIARDAVNNLSDAKTFLIRTAEDERTTVPEDKAPPAWQELADNQKYCKAVDEVKNIILAVFQASLSDAFLRQFLLKDEHIWLEEQGSGAALWRSDDFDETCENCAKSGFKPKAFAGAAYSDNDYHFFMPTQVEPFREFTDEAAKQDFLFTTGPQVEENFTGDWYHKPPSYLTIAGLPTTDRSEAYFWKYTYPNSYTSQTGQAFFLIRKGSSNNVLGKVGIQATLKNPLTPADAIALVVDRTLQTNDEWRGLVPEMTPFAARREHFMWGQWALDLPPEFSDDPLGDAALGRQMLALKIILESEVITNVPNFSAVSSTAPSYDAVLENLKDIGIPQLEGYEWGILQEFNAFHGNPYLYVEPPVLDPDIDGGTILTNTAVPTFFEKKLKKSLKKLGKSGIRGALAWMACSTNAATRAAILNITRSNYQNQYGGFEEYILALAKAHASEFGEYTDYLEDWYKLKTGDDKTMTRIIRAGQYPEFAEKTFEFLHDLQERGLPAYEAGLKALYQGTANTRLEYERRTNSYQLVTGFVPIDRVDGIYQMVQDDYEISLDLAITLFNLSKDPAEDIDIDFDPGEFFDDQSFTVDYIHAFSNVTVVGKSSGDKPFYINRILSDRSERTATMEIDDPQTFGNVNSFNHRLLDFPQSLIHTVNFDRVTSP